MGKRIATTLATVAASIAALLSLAGSASAGSFAADPNSLGPIPDGPPGGCTYASSKDVTFPVTGVTLPITNVELSMTLNPAHTRVGDLSVALISPDGVGITTIFERTGAIGGDGSGDLSDVAGPYTFSDDAAFSAAVPGSPSWWLASSLAGPFGTIPSGSYRVSFPGEQASPPPGESYLLTPAWAGYFAGTGADPNGTWILRFRDKCGGQTGSVAASTLTLDGTPPAPAAATPTSTSTSTGERAAALKRCKKKAKKNDWSKKRLKKCKRGAMKLPA